jgi:hypothetical protein
MSGGGLARLWARRRASHVVPSGSFWETLLNGRPLSYCVSGDPG